MERDPRLADVAWRDLVSVPVWRAVWQVFVPWASFAASLVCYGVALRQSSLFNVWWLPGFALSGFTSLSAMRVVHDIMHNSAGLGPRTGRVLLFFYSVLTLGSTLAYTVTHRDHHSRFVHGDDLENRAAEAPLWKAILLGLYYPPLVVVHGFARATPGQRAQILLEKTVLTGWLLAATFVWPLPIVWGHFAVMLLIQGTFTTYGIWLLHRGADRIRPARTYGSRLAGRLTLGMFYHLEHHLYPGVPTFRLHILADRIEAAAPDLRVPMHAPIMSISPATDR